MQLHSWRSSPLVSDGEKANSLIFIPEAGQALPVATTHTALTSCAVSSGSTFHFAHAGSGNRGHAVPSPIPEFPPLGTLISLS